MGFFSDLAADAKDISPANTQPDQAAGRLPIPQKARPAPLPGPVSQSDQAASGDTGQKSPVPTGSGNAPEPEMRQDKQNESEQAQLARLAAMSDQDAAAFSVQRVSADTERLTRRNMKDCVSEHIQGVCRENPAFARQVLHPRKTMARCFQYIYRKAQEFAEREMKELGESQVNSVYGIDVPDGLCYQWAEDYFKDLEAPEDQDKPKPVPSAAKTAAKKPPEKKSKAAIDGQLSLLGTV